MEFHCVEWGENIHWMTEKYSLEISSTVEESTEIGIDLALNLELWKRKKIPKPSGTVNIKSRLWLCNKYNSVQVA